MSNEGKMLRVTKEDTCFIQDRIRFAPGHGCLESGFYRRFLFENGDISWMYLIEIGDYEANSYSIQRGKSYKKLESLYQESEKRLTALNRDKQITNILL